MTQTTDGFPPAREDTAVGEALREEVEGLRDDVRNRDNSDPEAAFERTLDEGKRRLQRGWSALLATGFVGGIDVGTGVLGLLVVEMLTGGNKLLGGLAFSIGFIALTLARSELFTENFLVPVIAVVARQCSVLELLRLWGGTATFNLLGGWILTLLTINGYPSLEKTAIKAGSTYVDYGLGWRAFALALLGGLVITLMTWMQHTTESIGGKLVAAVVAAFLLGAGTLNHAIVASLLMFAALHTGHAPFGYLQWFEAALFSALGNVVGGVGLVTILRLLQVPERLKRERANPNPDVA